MLPINITELLEQNRIEPNRIEYKQGWNPAVISNMFIDKKYNNNN